MSISQDYIISFYIEAEKNKNNDNSKRSITCMPNELIYQNNEYYLHGFNFCSWDKELFQLNHISGLIINPLFILN